VNPKVPRGNNEDSHVLTQPRQALKGEQSKEEKSSQTSSVGSQPSDGKRELAPSSSVRRPSWYEMTLMDA
jgi:hypothetical protein